MGAPEDGAVSVTVTTPTARPVAPRWRTAGIRLAVRAAGAAILLVIVSMLTFALLQLAPGDAATARAGMGGLTAQEYAEARAQLGLDRPVVVQYLDWLGGAVQVDLGISLANGQPVSSLIVDRLPVTLSLTALALILMIPLSLLFGITAAVYEDRWQDRLVTGWASIAVAVPTFWLGLILVLVFAINTRVLPATGFVPIEDGFGAYLQHLILPGFTLAVPYSAALARQLRVSMTESLSADYVRTAEAKGIRWRYVVFKHALRNAAPPTVTLLGLELIAMLGGAVVVESVFALPGLGNLAINAVLARDTPVIQGILVTACFMAIVVNALVDLSYSALNPRLRKS